VTTTTLPSGGLWPATPSPVCASRSALDGPVSAPAGAVTVPAGDSSTVNFGLADTTYWLSAGIPTLGADQYAQIVPGNDSTYLGAPGAIVSGQGKNHYAFTGRATHVTSHTRRAMICVIPTRAGCLLQASRSSLWRRGWDIGTPPW
jgi:hypothetical protein